MGYSDQELANGFESFYYFFWKQS